MCRWGKDGGLEGGGGLVRKREWEVGTEKRAGNWHGKRNEKNLFQQSHKFFSFLFPSTTVWRFPAAARSYRSLFTRAAICAAIHFLPPGNRRVFYDFAGINSPLPYLPNNSGFPTSVLSYCYFFRRYPSPPLRESERVLMTLPK